MAKITYITSSGEKHEIEAANGTTVMENAVKNSVPGIEAECGGVCACATCHVYVDEAWLAKLKTADDEEDRMLDEAYQVQENSRLSCQLTFADELDGLKVTLAPEF